MSYLPLDHHPAYQAFLTWFQANLRPGLIDPTRKDPLPNFLPMDVLRDYFTINNYYNLKNLLRCAFYDSKVSVDADKVEDQCLKVFCILLLIGKLQFIQHFLIHDSLQDSHLPFNSQSPPLEFPRCSTDHNPSEFLEQFLEKQWLLCAPEISLRIHKNFEDRRVLPFRILSILGSGQSGILYGIEIHPAYNQLWKDDSNSSPTKRANKLALKTYIGKNAHQTYENELQAFRSVRCSEGLIRYYGSYTQGGRDNILLEYADKGNLEEYFEKVDPPCTMEGKRSFWTGLCKLVAGLIAIHNIKRSSIYGNFHPLHGWHQDVKPANTLVTTCGLERGSAYECDFKLADLGLSHFTRQDSPTERGLDQDSQGTIIYGAPECCRIDGVLQRSRLQISPTVDIWSLGCIFSEAAAWLVGGYEGLLQYRDQRKAATTALGKSQLGCCFHDSIEVLPTIKRNHEALVSQLSPDDGITKSILDMVENSMLIHESQRVSAVQIWKLCRKILEESYEGLESRNLVSKGTTMPKASCTVRMLNASTSPATSSNPLRPSLRPGDEYQLPGFPGAPSRQKENQIYSHDKQNIVKLTDERRYTDISGLGRVHPKFTDPSTTTNEVRDGSQALRHDNRPIQPIHSTSQSTDCLNQYRTGEVEDVLEWRPRSRPIFNSIPNDSSSATLTDRRPREHLNQIVGEISASSQRQYSSAAVIQAGGCLDENDERIPSSSGSGQFRTSKWAPNNEGSGIHQHLAEHYQETSSQPSVQTQPWKVRPRDIDLADRQHLQQRSYYGHSINSDQDLKTSQERQQLSELQFYRLKSTQQPDGPITSSSDCEVVSEKAIITTGGTLSSPTGGNTKLSQQLAVLTVAEAAQWRAKRDRREELSGHPNLYKLRARDHMFLVDDDVTMLPHWKELESLFTVLAYLVKKSDPDGIDLIFGSSAKVFNSKGFFNNSSTRLVDMVRQRQRTISGKSDVVSRLKLILDNYITKLEALNFGGSEVRKLNLYVLTNGCWESDFALPTLREFVKRLQTLGYNKDSKQVGIQFISFGNDSGGIKLLRDLDNSLGLAMDIVDSTPSNDNVWKMLLGGVEKEFDESS